MRIRLFSPRFLANCLHGRRFFISPLRWRTGADSQGNVGHLCFVLLLFRRARPPSEAEGNVCLPLGASCPLINLFSFGRCVMCLARVGVGVGVGNRSQSALGAMPSPDRDFGCHFFFFETCTGWCVPFRYRKRSICRVHESIAECINAGPAGAHFKICASIFFLDYL